MLIALKPLKGFQTVVAFKYDFTNRVVMSYNVIRRPGLLVKNLPKLVSMLFSEVHILTHPTVAYDDLYAVGNQVGWSDFSGKA